MLTANSSGYLSLNFSTGLILRVEGVGTFFKLEVEPVVVVVFDVVLVVVVVVVVVGVPAPPPQPVIKTSVKAVPTALASIVKLRFFRMSPLNSG